jgi:hypothetical protein
MNPIETINRMTAESKLMSIIRQLIVLTQDVRPEDISRVCDNLNEMISDINAKKSRRYRGDRPYTTAKPYNPFHLNRKSDPTFTRMA